MHETGFTKLFSTIITSSIWQENKDTKVLWITMLALANRYGEVPASLPGLAMSAGLTIEETEKALVILESPDHYSRSRAHEGRRVEKVEGGWQILNYTIYREKMRSRADYFKEYRKRNKNATGLTALQPIAEAEAEAEAEKEINKEKVCAQQIKDLSLEQQNSINRMCFCGCGKESEILSAGRGFASLECVERLKPKFYRR